MAQALLAARRTEDAIAAAEEHIRLAPRNPVGHILAARGSLRLKDLAAARKRLEHAAACSNGNHRTRDSISYLQAIISLVAGDFPGASKSLYDMNRG
jgi:hypothetical protein